MVADIDKETILGKVIEFVDVLARNLWGHFMDGVLWACDKVSGKKRCRRSKGDTW